MVVVVSGRGHQDTLQTKTFPEPLSAILDDICQERLLS